MNEIWLVRITDKCVYVFNSEPIRDGAYWLDADGLASVGALYQPVKAELPLHVPVRFEVGL